MVYNVHMHNLVDGFKSTIVLLFMHYVLLNLNIMLYVYAAENSGTFHPLVLNAADTGSVIDFVVLSTCS